MLRRFSLAAALVLLALPVFAQQSLQQRMSAEDFKAAGLDKLSSQELAHLDRWLQGTLATETARAADAAKKKVEDDNRGFFNFGKTDPIVGTLQGEFRGFARGRQYTLTNGQIWRQVDDAELAGVRLSSPGVRITPSLVGNVWYLAIEGYNSRAKVERVQ